jgi:enamine deaminase RidA (YjgF/YER057c/UK114 family)
MKNPTPVPGFTAVRGLLWSEIASWPCAMLYSVRHFCFSADMSAEANLLQLNVALPPAPTPVAVYKPLVIAGNKAYVSGHGPVQEDGSLIVGRVGADLTLEEGHAAARQVGLAILATLRKHLGSLDAVKRVVKVLGMVNSAPDFYDHPKVINGCSELFAEIWGKDNGVGARSAVGMGPLPGNIAVEIEVIFEINLTSSDQMVDDI